MLKNFKDNINNIKYLYSKGKVNHSLRLLRRLYKQIDALSARQFEELFLFMWGHGLVAEMDRFLGKGRIPFGDINTKDTEGRRTFYRLVRLNLIGADIHIFKFIKRIKVHTASEARYLGGIYILNGIFEKSIDSYQYCLKLCSNEDRPHRIKGPAQYYCGIALP